MKRDIAVIGLGTFGEALSKKLYDAGNNVLAIDTNSDKINHIKDYVTEAIAADATNENILMELNINKVEAVILCMSNNFENLILSLTYLKKIKAKKVYAKANTEIQKEILLKIGADEVILPEKEAALQLANKLDRPNIKEIFKIDDEIELIEVKVPPSIAGKSLTQLDLRKKYQITALILKKNGEKTNVITDPNSILEENDILLVTGEKNEVVKVFS